MATLSPRCETLGELRQFVKETLCQSQQLEQHSFPMTERILVRNGKPCGVYFCLHGPRAVKFTAIWEMDRNRVLFYAATGARFQATRLSHAPRL